MSAGRKRVSLEDLQGVADDGFATAVRRMLLGEDAPAGEIEPVLHKRPDALLSPDLDWEAFGRPADWAHRTTWAEVRRFVAKGAKARLAEADAPIVDMLVYGKRKGVNLIDREDALRVARILREVYKAEFAQLPTRPARERGIVKMPSRSTNQGQCSAVVKRFRTGALMCEGELISPDEADERLRTIGYR